MAAKKTADSTKKTATKSTKKTTKADTAKAAAKKPKAAEPTDEGEGAAAARTAGGVNANANFKDPGGVNAESVDEKAAAKESQEDAKAAEGTEGAGAEGANEDVPELQSFCTDITVAVTAKHDDGTLDLQEYVPDDHSESGYKKGDRWFQNVAADQVTSLKVAGKQK